MKRSLLILFSVVGGGTLPACDPCAGTVQCSGAPELNASGQLIVHASGAVVASAEISFARDSGPTLLTDTVRAVSDAEGYFALRGQAFEDGVVFGSLTVTAAQHPPYTVPNVPLRTTRGVGDGNVLGRLVVDPYFFLIGELRERNTEIPIAGATITARRVAGASLSPDTLVIVTDENGRFLVMPPVRTFGTWIADYEIDVPGHPRRYLVRQGHQVLYQDATWRFAMLHAGRAMFYVAQALRRATFASHASTSVEFARTGGIQVSPTTFTSTVGYAGGFSIATQPLEDGELAFDLTVRPPAPYPAETYRDVRIRTHDDDSVRYMGAFQYGAEAHLRARFRHRASGAVVNTGESVLARWVGGTPIETPIAADSGLRTIVGGKLDYEAATVANGNSTFNLEVRLRPPARQEVIPGVVVASVFDTVSTDVGEFAVGLWIPSTVQLLDDVSSAPVAGARVRFTRASGIAVTSPFDTVSAASGIARLNIFPLDSGEVVGTLSVSQAAGFRDTTIAGVRLRTTQDDTLRAINPIRLQRTTP